MIELESLFTITGVVAAFRYNDNGSLAESIGELTAENAKLAATLCFANGRIAHQNIDLQMTLFGNIGWPLRGWVMIGSELSICTVANVVCFVNSSQTSFNTVLHAIAQLEREYDTTAPL